MEKKRMFLFMVLISLFFVISGCTMEKVEDAKQISKLPPRQKATETILNDEIPSFAYDKNGNIMLYVSFQENISQEEMKRVIYKYGKPIGAWNSKSTLQTITIAKESIFDLINENSVNEVAEFGVPIGTTRKNCNELNESECKKTEYCEPEYVACEIQELQECTVDPNNASNWNCTTIENPCPAVFHECREIKK